MGFARNRLAAREADDPYRLRTGRGFFIGGVHAGGGRTMAGQERRTTKRDTAKEAEEATAGSEIGPEREGREAEEDHRRRPGRDRLGARGERRGVREELRPAGRRVTQKSG